MRLRKVTSVLVCCLLLGMTAASAATAAAPRVERQKLEVEVEKLRAEVDKVEGEVEHSSGLRGFLSQYGALITALVALIGVGITFRGQNKEQGRQREADRASRDRAIEQRDSEGERDLHARFSQLLLDLGSSSEAVQAGAAVSLLSFLDHQDPTFQHQVRLATLANLKVSHPAAVCKLLLRTFEQAMTVGDIPYDSLELDLSEADLRGANFAGLDLSGANLSGSQLHEANLRGAVLRDAVGRGVTLEGARLQGEGTSLLNARLPQAKCMGARFRGANLVNVHMEGADLRMARFDGAQLQAAHLEKDADLRGARFDGANVADTYFRDAHFDDDALRSLLKASNWEKAHLSPEAQRRLDELRADAKNRRPNE